MKKLHDATAEILENRPVNQPKEGNITYKLVLKLIDLDLSDLEIKPGHFAMVQTFEEGFDPLLRRPFAIADYDGKNSTLEIYYDVVGRGTRLLAQKKVREVIKLLLPLGEGVFPIFENREALIVAGGIGASGISLLAKELALRKIPTTVLYGARTKEFLSMLEWFESLKERFPWIKIFYYTDDGSYGKKGFPTQDLQNLITSKETVIYACGPKPLLKAIKNFSEKEEIETYLSLDRRMACGFGVCLGCVVKTSKGYLRVCKEGPVFKANELLDF